MHQLYGVYGEYDRTSKKVWSGLCLANWLSKKVGGRKFTVHPIVNNIKVINWQSKVW